MRILTVSSAGYGVKHVVYNLLDKLTDRGLDIDLLTLPIHEAPEHVNRITMLEEDRLLRLRTIQPFYLSYGIFYFWWKAYDFIKQQGGHYDAIWLHNPRLLPRYPTEHTDRLFITIHNHLQGEKVEHHSFPISFYYRTVGLIERKGIDSLSGAKFSVVYEPVVNELQSIGVQENDIEYIGNGVDTERFYPDGNRGNGGSESTFLYLGRLTHQKRPLSLIELFDALASELADVTLLVAGTGPLGPRAKELTSQHSLDNVEFLGFVDEGEKPDLYRSADFFILPSRYEGEPLSLYEALASGLPCIVSDLPNLQFVDTQGCGIAVNMEDVGGAAEYIKEYIQNEERIFSHQRKARQYAEAELSWEIKANEYYELLKTFE